jgi:hypothetical protein
MRLIVSEQAGAGFFVRLRAFLIASAIEMNPFGKRFHHL